MKWKTLNISENETLITQLSVTASRSSVEIDLLNVVSCLVMSPSICERISQNLWSSSESIGRT